MNFRLRARFNRVSRSTKSLLSSSNLEKHANLDRVALAELDIARNQESEHLKQIDELVGIQKVISLFLTFFWSKETSNMDVAAIYTGTGIPQ